MNPKRPNKVKVKYWHSYDPWSEVDGILYRDTLHERGEAAEIRNGTIIPQFRKGHWQPVGKKEIKWVWD